MAMDVKAGRDWNMVAAGVLLLLLALIFFLAPGLTLFTVALIAGAGLTVTGILDIVSYVRTRKTAPQPAWNVVYALMDIVIGLVFLIHPVAMSAVVPWIAAVCFFAFGVFSIVAAFMARSRHVPLWGWSLFAGVVDVLCGVAFFLAPESLVLFLALFVLMRAITLIVTGLSSRRLVLIA